MPTKKPVPNLWYVRLIKGDTYHSIDRGAIVQAHSAKEAEEMYKTVVKLDNGPEGEFAFYEPTAEVIEMDKGVGVL